MHFFGLGAVYCQVLDSLKAGVVPMAKVQWNACMDYEFLPNYKLVQKALTLLGIPKQVEVERLMKGRYQDNLEFCQYLFALWTRMHCESGRAYDASSRRALAKLPVFPEWAPTRASKIRRSPALPSTRASSVTLSDAPELVALERERDFYISKLTDLESALKSDEVLDKRQLLSILYSVEGLVSVPSSNYSRLSHVIHPPSRHGRAAGLFAAHRLREWFRPVRALGRRAPDAGVWPRRAAA